MVQWSLRQLRTHPCEPTWRPPFLTREVQSNHNTTQLIAAPHYVLVHAIMHDADRYLTLSLSFLVSLYQAITTVNFRKKINLSPIILTSINIKQTRWFHGEFLNDLFFGTVTILLFAVRCVEDFYCRGGV